MYNTKFKKPMYYITDKELEIIPEYLESGKVPCITIGCKKKDVYKENNIQQCV